ncbi:MAG: response regulator, partial [Gammaproteobacteria bacterium]|nr:response regulator [Gammaproteobacteria bacterium]
MTAVAPHVLALDDDPDIRRVLVDYLSGQDLRVSAVSTGQEMLAILANEPVDLLLLDLRLPGENGLELARHVRENSSVPILILSGQSEEADRIMGLELAADDYVTKPFSPRELLARIRAVLRRMQASESREPARKELRAYRFAGWELNARLHHLTDPAGRRVPLTNGEFSLLCAFLSAPRRVLTRDQLLERSRLHSLEVYDRSIDVTILRLRRKIEADPSNPRLLTTERGAGYTFTAEVSVL